MTKRTICLAGTWLCATYVSMVAARHVLAAQADNPQPTKKTNDFQPLFSGKDIPDSSDPTGSIYSRVRAERMPFIPGTWVLMQVFLEDRTCVVRVNGVVVAKSDKMPGASKGESMG